MPEPLELVARLVALLPPPRFHMLRYHGVLAAHGKGRAVEEPRSVGSNDPLVGADGGVGLVGEGRRQRRA